jgi:hypothetical protein
MLSIMRSNSREPRSTGSRSSKARRRSLIFKIRPSRGGSFISMIELPESISKTYLYGKNTSNSFAFQKVLKS